MMQATKYVNAKQEVVGIRLFVGASPKRPFTQARWTTPWGTIWERRAAGKKAELAGFEDPECPHVKASRFTFRTDLAKPVYNPHVWEDADFHTEDGEIDTKRPVRRRVPPVARIQGARRTFIPLAHVGPGETLVRVRTRYDEQRGALAWFREHGIVPDGEEEHRLLTIQQQIHSLAPLSPAEIAAPRDWIAYVESQGQAAEWAAYNALGEEVGFQLVSA